MLISLSSALFVFAPCALQGTPPPIPPPPTLESKAPYLDATGRPVEPGVLPPNTAPDAASAWEKTCAAHIAPGAERRAVNAFDLALDVRYKASNTQTNDFQARYRFLAPGYLRASTESQREQIRGPSGDWLVDAARNEKIRLDIGRTNEEDRRQLDESVAIAKNFVALFDPRSLRIGSLTRVADAPAGLPPSSGARAKACVWLEVVSPDFHLQRSKSAQKAVAPAVYRVSIGTDPTTNLVSFALIHDVKSPGESLTESTLFIELEQFKPLDGFVVPHHIRAYETDAARRPISFRSEPSSDIYVVKDKSNLRPTLTPQDFVP